MQELSCHDMATEISSRAVEIVRARIEAAAAAAKEHASSALLQELEAEAESAQQQAASKRVRRAGAMWTCCPQASPGTQLTHGAYWLQAYVCSMLRSGPQQLSTTRLPLCRTSSILVLPNCFMADIRGVFVSSSGSLTPV